MCKKEMKKQKYARRCLRSYDFFAPAFSAEMAVHCGMYCETWCLSQPHCWLPTVNSEFSTNRCLRYTPVCNEPETTLYLLCDFVELKRDAVGNLFQICQSFRKALLKQDFAIFLLLFQSLFYLPKFRRMVLNFRGPVQSSGNVHVSTKNMRATAVRSANPDIIKVHIFFFFWADLCNMKIRDDEFFWSSFCCCCCLYRLVGSKDLKQFSKIPPPRFIYSWKLEMMNSLLFLLFLLCRRAYSEN